MNFIPAAPSWRSRLGLAPPRPLRSSASTADTTSRTARTARSKLTASFPSRDESQRDLALPRGAGAVGEKARDLGSYVSDTVGSMTDHAAPGEILNDVKDRAADAAGAFAGSARSALNRLGRRRRSTSRSDSARNSLSSARNTLS